MHPFLPGRRHPGIPALLLAAAFFWFQFLPCCPASPSWSGAASREAAGPFADLRMILEEAEARAGEEDPGQDACRTVPDDEKPFRRAPGPVQRPRLSGSPSGSPAPPAWAAASPAFPPSAAHGAAVPGASTRGAGIPAFPYYGCYPAFLFSDLPPPARS